jgi:hypothetical protein
MTKPKTPTVTKPAVTVEPVAVIQAPATVTPVEVPAAPVPKPHVETKADIARKLYKAMKATSTRQELLKAFQEKAGLTPSGSATYLANFKKEI